MFDHGYANYLKHAFPKVSTGTMEDHSALKAPCDGCSIMVHWCCSALHRPPRPAWLAHWHWGDVWSVVSDHTCCAFGPCTVHPCFSNASPSCAWHPQDNLLPVSCGGKDWQGGIGVTLIDAFDSLLVGVGSLGS